MKTNSQKHAVISLSHESFKHYLVQRYAENPEKEYTTREDWINLYNHAKEDMEKSGGRIIGYELVDEELVSHERINSYWPANWMWVLQFNQH
ncbi:hypothetical protein [Dyadobacter luticola]|uniref:Uncharacterized protein n=1 Tax=Dyadobacter luticola TaxID=1979387 RepID=A0A5R9L1B8_9BACT|nr:hypothetical protein [Dyadobacter luticola]TLV02145.1 hypothetical protein FEN17_00440 [Dyadobacter luticola]